MMTFAKDKASILFWAFLAVGLVVWLLFFLPGFLGGPAGYVVVSGESMEPALHSGDLVVTRSADEYEVGDVVAFRVPEGIVIHRIIGGNGDEGYELQGDNRNSPDEWSPTNEEVIGKQWLHLPGAGKMVALLAKPFVIATIASLLAMLSVVGGSEKKGRGRDDSLEQDGTSTPEQKKDGWRQLPRVPWLTLLFTAIASAGLLSLALMATNTEGNDR